MIKGSDYMTKGSHVYKEVLSEIVEDKRESRKTSNISISFTKAEKDYLDGLCKRTGANRHEVLSALLDLHGEEAGAFLCMRDERDEALIKVKVLKDANSYLNDELAMLRLKVKNLEKESEVKKKVEESPAPLDFVSEEIEKPKKGKFQIWGRDG